MKTIDETKNIFFTPHVIGGGMAAADVSPSGSAEIRLVGGSNMDVDVFRNVRLKAAFSGETGTRTPFGIALELRKVGECQDVDDSGAIRIFGVFGTLTVGDTDSAFDKAMPEVPAGSSINDNRTGHAGMDPAENDGLDAGGEIVRYNHNFGDVSLAPSTQNDDGDSDSPGDDVMAAHGIGVGWSGELVGALLGRDADQQQRSNTKNIVGASLSASPAGGLGFGVGMSRIPTARAPTQATRVPASPARCVK